MIKWQPKVGTGRRKRKVTVSVVLDDVTYQEALWKAEQIRRRTERIRPRATYTRGIGYRYAEKPVAMIESVEDS